MLTRYTMPVARKRELRNAAYSANRLIVAARGRYGDSLRREQRIVYRIAAAHEFSVAQLLLAMADYNCAKRA